MLNIYPSKNLAAINLPPDPPNIPQAHQNLSAGITNPALGSNLQLLLAQGPAAFFQKFLPMAVGFAFLIGAIIFLFLIIIGAIQWMASGGDKASIEAARGRLINALIGVIILFATFAIIKIFETFFGINLLQLDVGPLQIA